jgi:predicted RND superfamily exporter protein
VVLLAVFAVGCFFVKAELNNVSLFKSDDPIAVADTKLNEALAGTQSLNLVLDTDLTDVLARTDAQVADGAAEPVALVTPDVLNKVEAFSTDVLKKFPYVTKVMSFNDMIKKMNQEMNGGDPKFYAIPQDPQLISQYLLIFTGDLQSVLSSNHDKLRVTVTMKRTSTDESEAVARYILDYFGGDFLKTNHVQANITGAAHLYYVANTLLLEGTAKSIVICIVVVFLLLLIVLKDFWISLIAMLPIFLTLVINFGMLGLFNIPLNAGTAMVSSVAIGIGVDYSIHYITWYRREIRQNRDIALALENTILHKGRAILYNMLVIFGGFLVMVVSKFIPLIQFGVLVAICMVTTAVGSLVIVPAVMKLLAKKDRKFLYMEKIAVEE